MPKATTVTVTTDPTPLVPSPPNEHYEVNAAPPDGVTVYFGGRLVSAAGARKGRAVAGPDEFEGACKPQRTFYAIVASGTADVSVITDEDE